MYLCVLKFYECKVFCRKKLRFSLNREKGGSFDQQFKRKMASTVSAVYEKDNGGDDDDHVVVQTITEEEVVGEEEKIQDEDDTEEAAVAAAAAHEEQNRLTVDDEGNDDETFSGEDYELVDDAGAVIANLEKNCGIIGDFGGALSPDSNSSSDVRRYCSVCDLTFYSMRQLSEHLRDSHGIDKPFQCLVCKARFPYSSSLYNHTRIHSENKPFRCDQCDAAFRWKNSLKHHKRFIHKVLDPIDLEKISDVSFANTLKSLAAQTMPPPAPPAAAPTQSPSLKRARSKKSTMGSLPVRVVMQESSASSSRRPLFPQYVARKINFVQPPNTSSSNGSNVVTTPTSMGNTAPKITVTTYNLSTNGLGFEEESGVDEMSSGGVAVDDEHSCGHCGEKFSDWDGLTKHLVECEKGKVGPLQQQQQYEREETLQLPAKKFRGDGSSTSSRLHADGGEPCGCATSQVFVAKLKEMERKYSAFEKATNDRIARLEATVADLYDVAVEMDAIV